MLALDVGQQYLRGAVSDLAGIRRSHGDGRGARGGRPRPGRRAGAASRTSLCADAGVSAGRHHPDRHRQPRRLRPRPRRTDPRRRRSRAGTSPRVLTELRAAFGDALMIENDVDVAALAEQAHGHGRDVDSFAFVSVGTGIGMGLVLGGQLHRGAHGAAGEIGFLPLNRPGAGDSRDARRRGSLEAAGVGGRHRTGCAQGRHARTGDGARRLRRGRRGRRARRGRRRRDAVLVAQAICAVVTVVDPELIVLGGGIGQAPGFRDAVGGRGQAAWRRSCPRSWGQRARRRRGGGRLHGRRHRAWLAAGHRVASGLTRVRRSG